MKPIQLALRRLFEFLEGALDGIFGKKLNPLYQLGALGFYFLWIVFVSGVYIYIFFDTSVVFAYESVEYMTHQQWYLAGVMRSLHRYASDACVVVVIIHLAREFSLDRFHGKRWFSWATGIPALWFLIISGITGYWLVWDKLAQYVAIQTTEWLDAIPIFGESIASNFVSPEALSDRFFTLLIFIHIAAPLILLLILWVHLQRVTKAKINPGRSLAVGMGVTLLALSIVMPAVSQGPADLSTMTSVVKLDWFYLGAYPLLDYVRGDLLWVLIVGASTVLTLFPWLPSRKDAGPAVVDLDNCNGCTRCVADCPYNAISMVPRSDGKPFAEEAVVNNSLCVGCGICVGACPSSTPFRRIQDLKTGIDLPDRSLAMLRDETEKVAKSLAGKARVLVFGCDHGIEAKSYASKSVGAVSLPCVGQLPPSMIDYVLSRNLADGVMVSGCQEIGAYNRFGVEWMKQRIARERDPYLRERVPRERLLTKWLASSKRGVFRKSLADFQNRLEALGDIRTSSADADKETVDA